MNHLKAKMSGIAILICFVCGLGTNLLPAQIGIGTTNPHPSTMLHINPGPGQNKGVLLPAISSTNLSILDSTQNIANGLIMFDLDLQKHYYFNNSPQLWMEIDHDWVREDVHGPGATQGQNIHLGVNGNVGIGTTNPQAKASILGNLQLGDADWMSDSIPGTAFGGAAVHQWLGIGVSTQSSDGHALQTVQSIPNVGNNPARTRLE